MSNDKSQSFHDSRFGLSPENAYEGFFTTFNAQDTKRWVTVLNYPHVRVSPRGSSQVIDTEEANIPDESWEQVRATGWVRTVQIPSSTIHKSEEKAHLSGGWTRYNVNDEPILSNRVTYVMTRVGSQWGIQARFGVDSFKDSETNTEAASACEKLVADYCVAFGAREWKLCVNLANYPLTNVGIGTVEQFNTALDLENWLSSHPLEPISSFRVKAVQVGRRGVNVAASCISTDGGIQDVLFLAGRPKDDWRIIGQSMMRV